MSSNTKTTKLTHANLKWGIIASILAIFVAIATLYSKNIQNNRKNKLEEGGNISQDVKTKPKNSDSNKNNINGSGGRINQKKSYIAGSNPVEVNQSNEGKKQANVIGTGNKVNIK